MCGIVGLYAKNQSINESLGVHIAAMLVQMGERGPDSAGVAFYSAGSGASRVTVQDDNPEVLEAVASRLSDAMPLTATHNRGTHLSIESNQSTESIEAWLVSEFPDLRIMSAGTRIEIYKEKGHPTEFVDAYALEDMQGTHALGHTRMATESAITTSHSHPFSTGLDLCLVHNGSLSNHNRLREQLQLQGIEFQTDNDSEVAAGYLTWRLVSGDSLREALESALRDLDGFYTFAIGTRNGFAVLRDPIACKPAILAETDDWVAMSSEYRAIAQLPGAEHARVWEPEPATIYTWEG
ncbi:MAG: glutamine amidotransferase family protein [Gammaproteobacteria bacterium]|nr:glutamine amidotransferase family protein [Gammaproteobacteria bacterium]